MTGPPESAAAPRVAVIGAGVSGLAAAARLLDLAEERGRTVEVRVFESEAVGGGCRTLIEEHAGERIVRELGPDSFLSRPPHMVTFCERVGLGAELIGTHESPRGALVWCGDRAERVPAGFTLLAPSRWGPTLRSRTLTPLHKARLLTEPLRRRGVEEDESIGAFVRRRLGAGVLERLAQPLAAGIYAGDVDRLSLAACLPQFAADERTRGRVTGKKPDAATADGGARYSLFVTPRAGVGAIPAAAARLLGERGATLSERTPVRSVSPTGGGWTVRLGDGAIWSCAATILAVPARVAADLLREDAAALAGALGAIESSSSVVVNTLHREADVRHRLDAFGLVVPERFRAGRGEAARAGLEAFAVSFASRKFPGRAPAGRVQLRTFLGGFGRPKAARQSRERILAAAREELGRLLGVTWTDEAGETARVGLWDRAMPQYHVGHLARVAAIGGLLSGLPGLEQAGNGLHGVGLPAAVKSGTDAADRAFAGLGEEDGTAREVRP